MGRFRVSIAKMMVAVLIVAVNAGAMREADRWQSPLRILIYTTLPSISLLALCGFAIARDLWRRGEARPFLVGYLLAGWPPTCAAGAYLVDGARLGIYLETLLGPAEWILEAMQPTMGWALVSLLGDTLAAVACMIPQVAPALLGGWLARRCGLTLVVSWGGGRGARLASLSATPPTVVGSTLASHGGAVCRPRGSP